MIDLGGLKNGRGGVSTRFHLYNKICVHSQCTTYPGYIGRVSKTSRGGGAHKSTFSSEYVTPPKIAMKSPPNFV